MEMVLDDQVIVQKFFNRCEEAITDSQRKYGRYCHTIAFNILFSEEDTEECLNDTWMQTWNAIPPQCPACFQAFLAKITRNIALNMYRAQNALKRAGDRVTETLDELVECTSLHSDNVEENFDRQVLEDTINSFLEKVPEKKRKIFVRRYFYMDSIEEIAGMYGIKKSLVKVTLLRLRRELQYELEENALL